MTNAEQRQPFDPASLRSLGAVMSAHIATLATRLEPLAACPFGPPSAREGAAAMRFGSLPGPQHLQKCATQ